MNSMFRKTVLKNILETSLPLDIFGRKQKRNKEFTWMLPRLNPDVE